MTSQTERHTADTAPVSSPARRARKADSCSDRRILHVASACDRLDTPTAAYTDAWRRAHTERQSTMEIGSGNARENDEETAPLLKINHRQPHPDSVRAHTYMRIACGSVRRRSELGWRAPLVRLFPHTVRQELPTCRLPVHLARCAISIHLHVHALSICSAAARARDRAGRGVQTRSSKCVSMF
jgi:hypothetical protein